MHVHVASAKGNAKYWLEPIVALAGYHGLGSRELSKIEAIVQERKNEFIADWHKHFEQ